MERSNFIEIEKILNQINEAFSKHIEVVTQSASAVNNLGTAYKNAMPSDLVKAYQEADKAGQQSAKTAQLNVTTKQQEALANAQVSESIIGLSKQYKNETGSLGSLIKTNEQYRNSLQRIRQQIKAKTKDLTGANGVIKSADKDLISLRAREQELSKAMQENSRAINVQVKEMMAADGSMDQMSQTLGRLRTLFRSLSTEQREGAFGQELQGNIKRLDGELKKLDSTIGNHQRNVGNYAQQWDGLRHETNQLVRELPAMAYGANVFFGAISNNLPMFIDQVKLAREQQKLAIAEGKEAPSVMKRITGALFNWQTAIVLGLTYLTLHGREVWNWVQSLWGASSALEELSKRQDEFNNAQLEGRKSAQAEIIELRKNLAVIKDKNVADDLRVTAIKQLRQQYPRYFKDLTDEELLTWKAGQAIQSLTEALEKRKEVEQKTDLNVLNRQRLIQLESEESAVRATIKARESQIKSMIESGIAGQGLASVSNNLRAAENKLQKINEEQAEIQKNLISNEEDIIRLRKETIALEWQDEKATKDKTKATYDYVSALESEYQLRVLYFESEIEMNRQISEDEKKGYDIRANALIKMYDDQERLSEIHRNEELRLLNIQYDEELALLEEARKNGIITEINYYNQLQEIRDKFNNNEAIIIKNSNDRIEEISHQRVLFLDVQIKKLWEYNQALLDVSRVEQNRLFANTNELEGLNFNNVLKEYERVQKERTNIAEEAEIDRLKIFIKSKDEEMAEFSASSADYQELANEKIQAENRLEQIRQRNADAEAQRIRKLAQDYKNLMQGFQNEVLNTFPAIQKLISEDFQKLIDDLMAEGEFGKAAMAIGLQVSEAFQQMYNMMQTYSDAYYNQQYERLEMQRDVAIKFAGESAVAREEVERVYDEKKRRIERDQAKRQKEMAVFNAVINTAQAIVAALANPGGPAGIALAALVGVLGAAQVAMIAAQPLPAFAMGGTHSGGMMLVNDAKGSKYKETIVTPDGKIMQPKGRNVVMNAPKGTEIFTPDQWNNQLANILLSNGIMPPKQQKGITKEDLKEAFSGQIGSSGNGVEINIDKQGFNTMIRRNGQKVKKLDSRIRIKNIKR